MQKLNPVFWFTAVLLAADILWAADDDLIINSFQSQGRLTWSHALTTGHHRVEWAPAVTGSWQSSWQQLTHLPATGGTTSVKVPMFYRVVWSTEFPDLFISRNEVVGAGNSIASFFSGFLSHSQIVARTVSLSAGAYFLVDDGAGFLSGNNGAIGYIVYETGAWALDLNGVPLPNGVSILASYQYASPDEPVNIVTNNTLGTGDTFRTTFYGVLAHAPLLPRSVSVATPDVFLTDDGAGTLTGKNVIGSIVYATGACCVRFLVAPPAAGSKLIAGYRYVDRDPGLAVDQNVTVAVGAGATTTFSGVLPRTSIMPGTLSFSAGEYFLRDDGSGVLAGGTAHGFIVYATGAWFIDFGVVLGIGMPVLATYEWQQD